jgi:hypothetical protein
MPGGSGFQTTSSFYADIEIGAVEIKDGVSDNRASVVPIGGGLYGLVVTSTPTPGPALINTYNKVTAIPRLTESTVVSYTVPIGQTFYFTLAQATGDTEAIFYLQVNGSNQLSLRSNWSERNVRFDISQYSLQVAGGGTIRLRVYHEELVRYGVQDFWGNISGILI